MRRRIETVAMLASLTLLVWVAAQRLMPSPRPDGGWREVPGTLAGEPIEPFRVVSLSGDTINVPVPGVRTTVVGYRTTCPYCGLSASRWTRLPERTCDIALVFVSVEQSQAQRDFWQARSGGPPGAECSQVVVGRPVDEAQYRASTQIRSVPQHILIDHRGRADAVWVGPLGSQKSLDRLVERIVTLPARSGG